MTQSSLRIRWLGKVKNQLIFLPCCYEVQLVFLQYKWIYRELTYEFSGIVNPWIYIAVDSYVGPLPLICKGRKRCSKGTKDKIAGWFWIKLPNAYWIWFCSFNIAPGVLLWPTIWKNSTTNQRYGESVVMTWHNVG